DGFRVWEIRISETGVTDLDFEFQGTPDPARRWQRLGFTDQRSQLTAQAMTELRTITDSPEFSKLLDWERRGTVPFTLPASGLVEDNRTSMEIGVGPYVPQTRVKFYAPHQPH